MFVLSVIVFYAARLAPGDPLASYYGERVEKISPKQRAQTEEALGLHDPVSVQYVRWLSHAVRGDFGISYKYKRKALDTACDRIPNTLLLGGSGFLLIFVLALLLGLVCAWFEDSLADRIICRLGVVTSSIPEFWLCFLFIYLFCVRLRLLPASGAYTAGKEQDLIDRLMHLALPAAVVVISHLWYYACLVRNKIVEEMRADYVLLAKAKGLDRREVLLRHCLRNVLPAYFSIMAVGLPHILGGTYLIEIVFSYPGIGTLSYESVRYKDYNLLMVLCLFFGALVIACSLAAQAANERIDPAIRKTKIQDGAYGL